MKIEDMLATKRRSWAEIDLDHTQHNFVCIRQRLAKGTKLCCVIKANAYGHSAVQLADLYQQLGADYLAVSNIEEALQLRQHEIHLPILILGYTPADCAALLAKYDITQCVYSYEYGMALSQNAVRAGVTVKVHIKLDTGMGRIGFVCRDADDEVETIAAVCHAEGLDTEGVFMHFAVADEGEDGKAYTASQFTHFMSAIAALEKLGVTFRIRHCANSAAIFDYPEFHLDMVRAGVVLYGLKPSQQVQNLPDLKPVMSLHSVIAHIKTLQPGQSVSYGRTYTAEKAQRVATIPLGYADGFRRMNGQQRYSLCVNGKSAQILGRVCMDQLMVDVTDIECNLGDEVLVFGDVAPYTVDEIARINGTINYEIVCDVGERVPRAFVQDGAIIGWRDDIIGE